MSYMNRNPAFAGAIQELSFDEIGEVGGGPLPLLAIGKAIGYATAAAAGTAAGVGIAKAAAELAEAIK
jgi:hypothetical protein